jgi:hypothetical protein
MASADIEGITNNFSGSPIGTPLTQILMSDNIELGSGASYELCKLIYSYHPLGAKLVDTPVELAQSQGRTINVPGAAEERVRKAFRDEWKKIDADRLIANCVRLGRIYGIASIAIMIKDEDATKPLDFAKLADKKLTFNVFDPLNTAGSLVLNQNPNEPGFLKPISIRVQGLPYITRTAIFQNEDPIYLDYTTSAYGYVGRSVYQRALFPLKSFLQSMITDDLVTKKAGVIVAKLKAPGSIINNVMQAIAGVKRQLLKEAVVGNVLNIGTDEDIESLDLANIDTAARSARKNILENIAAAAGMPAKLVNSETLAVAFAEGEAWNYEFYETLKADHKDLPKTYNEAFVEWTNHFICSWPSLLTEPDSEKIKVANVKLRSIIALMDTLLPMADPESMEMLIESAVDNFNDMKILFPTPFKIDAKKMAKFAEDQAKEEKENAKKAAETGGKPGGGKPGASKEGKSGKGFGGSAFGGGGGGGVKSDSEEVNDSVVDYLEEISERRRRSPVVINSD